MIYTNFSQLCATQNTVVIQNAVKGVTIDKYAEAFGQSNIMNILMDTEKPLTDYIAVIKKAIAVNRERALAALIQIIGQTKKVLEQQSNNESVSQQKNDIAGMLLTAPVSSTPLRSQVNSPKPSIDIFEQVAKKFNAKSNNKNKKNKRK